MEQEFQKLKQLLQEVSDLNSIGSLLYWDQSTYMPAQGAEARGRQLAYVSKQAHEKSTRAEIGQLAEKCVQYFEKSSPQGPELAISRVVLKDFLRSSRVPTEFVGELSEHASKSYEAWIKARPANDFQAMIPFLKKNLELTKKYTSYFSEFSHPLDALMEETEPGLRVSFVEPMFKELRTGLQQILQTHLQQQKSDDSCIKKFYAKDKQLAFGLKVAQDFGYSLASGRQDETHHPFMTKIAKGDTRILTRVNEYDFGDAFFSTTHEAGHALYEMGISEAFAETSCYTGTSVGVHESQSRLWENVVGRSFGFWQYYYPFLQEVFPENLKDTSLTEFYWAINKVSPSLIRVDADELTYNMHVIVRFEIEKALLEGQMQVEDLPRVWNEKYQEYLGIEVPDFKMGCLQDVHWFGGSIGGYFQGYTMGNILSAQFYASACKAHPQIPLQISQGQFSLLHTWLKENIYQYGRSIEPLDLIRQATGEAMSLQPYLQYLKTKYNFEEMKSHKGNLDFIEAT